MGRREEKRKQKSAIESKEVKCLRERKKRELKTKTDVAELSREGRDKDVKFSLVSIHYVLGEYVHFWLVALSLMPTQIWLAVRTLTMYFYVRATNRR